jgi:hypothetical protein
LLRKVLYGIAASAALALLPGIAMAQSSTNAQPVDPPKQVAQLRQQYEGFTPQQIKAAGHTPEGPCVPNPQGAGGMGIHAINPKRLQAQFPSGTMDPTNPPVLLLDENSKVIGVEWEAKDVGQGPMKMFGQTIRIQPAHPGVPEPHYMLHIYFKPNGKVLFGTNPQTEFDPTINCPPMPASAMASAMANGAMASATTSATTSAMASATATASSSASALPGSGGAVSLTPLVLLALLMVGTGVLAFRVVIRRSSS